MVTRSLLAATRHGRTLETSGSQCAHRNGTWLVVKLFSVLTRLSLESTPDISGSGPSFSISRSLNRVAHTLRLLRGTKRYDPRTQLSYKKRATVEYGQKGSRLVMREEGPVVRGQRRLRLGGSIPTTDVRSFLDIVITLHPVSSQLKTILSAYYAANALWEYYKAYETGGPPEVAEAYGKDRAVDALTDLQRDATWNLIGADKFVPPLYKESAKAVLSKVMTTISKKEVEFIEGYLEKRTSS